MRKLLNFCKSAFILIGRLIINNLDVVFVFLLTFIILLPRTGNLCNQITEFNFDTQNLLLWNYLKDLGTFPIKDTFFPHGFFYYFIANNSFALFVYLLLSPIYYSIIFISFKKLYKSKPVIYFLLFTLLFLLINSLLNARSFTRYGMLLVGGVLISLLNVYVGSGFRKGILVGLLSGLAVFASEGIGILLAILGILLLLISFNLKKRNSEKLSRFLSNELLGFVLGLLVGLLPLFIILIKNNMIAEYLIWMKDIKAISVYAKAPLQLKGRYSFFILGTILIQIIFILKGFKDKFRREKPIYYFMLLSVILSNLLLIPRYVVRQENNIFIFYQLYGLSILFYPLASKAFRTNLSRISITTSIFVFYITLAFSLSIPLHLDTYARDLNFGLKQISRGNLLERRLCNLNEIKLQNTRLDKSYFEVFEYIKREYPKAKFFSYPYDPVFYLLFEQKPPPYPNVYEGSPEWAQDANIKYLKENSIDIVIYNTKSIAVDSIPEHLRVPILNKYIFEKYLKHYESEPFIIMIMKEKSVESS